MKSLTVLVMCLLPGHVLAAEPTSGTLMAAVVREAARIARIEASAAQASGTPPKQHTGHPLLIGAAVGAAALGVAAYATASCSVPPPNDEIACGKHYKGGSALLGAGIGAAAGALIGLFFRH